MKSIVFIGSAFGLLLTWLFVLKDIEQPALHVIVAIEFLILIGFGLYFEATE